MSEVTNHETQIVKKLSAGVVALITVVSALTLIFTLAIDVSAVLGSAVDFYDIPLDLHTILKFNFLSVVGLYFILEVKDAAQRI